LVSKRDMPSVGNARAVGSGNDTAAEVRDSVNVDSKAGRVAAVAIIDMGIQIRSARSRNCVYAIGFGNGSFSRAKTS